MGTAPGRPAAAARRGPLFGPGRTADLVWLSHAIGPGVPVRLQPCGVPGGPLPGRADVEGARGRVVVAGRDLPLAVDGRGASDRGDGRRVAGRRVAQRAVCRRADSGLGTGHRVRGAGADFTPPCLGLDAAGGQGVDPPADRGRLRRVHPGAVVRRLVSGHQQHESGQALPGLRAVVDRLPGAAVGAFPQRAEPAGRHPEQDAAHGGDQAGPLQRDRAGADRGVCRHRHGPASGDGVNQLRVRRARAAS